MDEILAGIPGCICYIDDILVDGGSQEEHDQRLDIVLDRLNRTGSRLKEEKFTFNTSEVEYLGHLISEKGLRPLESKYGAIGEAPQPQKVTQLKLYLGLLNCYGRFYRISQLPSNLCTNYSRSLRHEFERNHNKKLWKKAKRNY